MAGSVHYDKVRGHGHDLKLVTEEMLSRQRIKILLSNQANL